MQVFRENRSLSYVACVTLLLVFLAQTINGIQAAPPGNNLQQQELSYGNYNDALKYGVSPSRVKRSLYYDDINPHAHRILVRQNQDVGNQGETDFRQDDLVSSLIRLRDDYIAAAAIPQSPLPQQTMRRNLNSGL